MPSDFERAPGPGFPPTRRSAIALVGSDDPAEAARAFELLVRAYWRPVYAHVRLRWRRTTEDARDLSQEFFARVFEKRHLGGFDPSRAMFRTYLKGALDNFVRETDRSARREKRGGGILRLSLDFDLAEEDLARLGPRDPATLEACFDAEWTRSLFTSAVHALESRCSTEGKVAHLSIFRRFVLDPEREGTTRPTYADLARDLGLSVTDVTNHLAWARRTFRELVLESLREITATDDEFRSEARALFGVDP